MESKHEEYTSINARFVDSWVEAGWEWGQPIDHETFLRARAGDWSVVLTPTIPVPRREGYEVEIVKADMTKVFPFADESFDLIFHPVSNCYVRDVLHVWRECSRVLRRKGALLAGLDNGINYLFDDDETKIVHSLPFDPLSNPDLYEECIRDGWGIQFSHSIEEQVGGQLMAGFRLTDIFQDYNSVGNLKDRGVPTFYATRAVKE